MTDDDGAAVEYGHHVHPVLHIVKPVATIVLAPTKGPSVRPASRNPPSSLSLTLREDIAPIPIITAKVTIISPQLSML